MPLIRRGNNFFSLHYIMASSLYLMLCLSVCLVLYCLLALPTYEGGNEGNNEQDRHTNRALKGYYWVQHSFIYKAHFIHISFTRNAIHLITRIIWIQDSFTCFVLHVMFYLINFSDFCLSFVYSDQLFGSSHYMLNILSR